MNTLHDLLNAEPETLKNVLKRGLQMLVTAGIMAVLFFVSAGTLAWAHAWIYLALFLGTSLLGALILPLSLIAERGSFKQSREAWDKLLTRCLLCVLLCLYLTCGLDQRYGWTPQLPFWVFMLALGVFALASVLQIWAMWSNPFFSTAVRIQFERGHTVVSKGPYQYLRHPGYLAMIFLYLASPLLLDSLWGLIPGIGMDLLFIVRTFL